MKWTAQDEEKWNYTRFLEHFKPHLSGYKALKELDEAVKKRINEPDFYYIPHILAIIQEHLTKAEKA